MAWPNMSHIIDRRSARLYQIKSPLDRSVIRTDTGGDGHFGAHRTDHIHQGVDLKCNVGQPIYAPIDGEITKIGRVSTKHSLRFIEITGNLVVEDINSKYVSHKRCIIRLLYVIPGHDISKGKNVKAGDCLGSSADLHTKDAKGHQAYPNNVGQHLHVEIYTGGKKDTKSNRIRDPENILPIEG
jgi:murein DD-endopeptidase MepM/ murein hydrolase activator NlpD